MLLGAMLAMVVVAAAPAVAQIGQGFETEDIESGEAAPSVGIRSTGSNVNLCQVVTQPVQTGNVVNTQGVVQYKGVVDDVEVEGSAILLEPSGTVDCDQLIRQAATSKGGEAKAGGAEAKAAPAQAKAGGAEAKAGGPQLPKTGGIGDIAPLLGIGAGALLMTGGLIARRMMR